MALQGLNIDIKQVLQDMNIEGKLAVQDVNIEEYKITKIWTSNKNG